MLFAGFAVADPGQSASHHHLTMLGIVARRAARHDGRLVGRLRGRPRRAPGAARTPRRRSSTWARRRSSAPNAGSSATASRSCCSGAWSRWSAPSSRCPRASRGCRSGASPCSRCSARSPGCSALAFAGHALGGDWTSVRKGFEYVDYVILALIVLGIVYADRPSPARRPTGRGAERGPTDAQLTRERARSPGCPSATPLALGLLQGPTELLPVSSSAHTDPDPVARRLALRRARPGAAQVLRGGAPRRRGAARWRSTCAASCARAAAARWTGAARRCDRALAARRRRSPATRCEQPDRAPPRRAAHDRRRAARRGGRRWRSPTPAPPDGGRGALRRRARAATGSRSAWPRRCALIPGVSRSGATLTAARARGFSRADAQTLVLAPALPVILGASALKTGALLRAGRRGGRRSRGGSRARRRAAAFLSTLGEPRALAARGGRARATRARCCPTALYRCLLAAAAWLAPPARGRTIGGAMTTCSGPCSAGATGSTPRSGAAGCRPCTAPSTRCSSARSRSS